MPADQVNQNVLATETPSQAPAPPSPKEQQRVDETAIPILGKQVKPKQQTTPKTQQHQPTPPQNQAQYGEQSGSVMPHQMQPGTIGQTTVGDNNFASMYPVVRAEHQQQQWAASGTSTKWIRLRPRVRAPTWFSRFTATEA